MAPPLQVSQLLWGHAQLGHASPALVDALYQQLETAEVAAGGGGSMLGGASASGGAGPSIQLLFLSNMSAAVNLCYALAKLGRPPPAAVARLAAVLLAAAEAGEWAAEEAAQQLEGQAAGWAPLDSAEEEEVAEAAAEGGSGSSAARSSGGPASGVSLAACDSRGLCLLVWSLAELGACPPALLRHATAALRRRGLAGLSVQSMGHALSAAQRLASASSQAQLEQPWPAAGNQRRRQQEERFSWDQGFVDAVAAELAQRWQPEQRGQQRQWQGRRQQQAQGRRQEGVGKPPRPPQRWQQQQHLRLNEIDCSILARALAAAWQEAAAASGAATGGGRACGEVAGRSPCLLAAVQGPGKPIAAASIAVFPPRPTQGLHSALPPAPQTTG